MEAPAAKEHRFALVEVHEQFGPRRIVVDEARVKAFAFAQDDCHPWHFGPSPFGGPVAHPSLLANELMQIYFERYRIDVHEDADGAWLEEAHVEESLWFESPLMVGEEVELRGRFVDKYVIGGRGAVVLEGEARGADGRVVLRHRAVEYFRLDGPLEDDPPRSGAPMRRVARDVKGTPLGPLEKTISFPQLLVYSSLEYPGARRSIHNDFEISARAGLAAPLVQGQQLAAYLAELMERLVGASWYEGGAIRAKFLGAVCAAQTVRIEGVVRDLEAADRRVEVDAWVADEAGGLVVVANASGPRPPAS